MMGPVRDIRLPLRATPTGDLATVTGLDAVRQRLRVLILSSPGDLLHRPQWGSGVPADAAEPADAGLLARLRGRIRTALAADADVEAVERCEATADDAGQVDVTVWVRVAGRVLTYDGLRVT